MALLFCDSFDNYSVLSQKYEVTNGGSITAALNGNGYLGAASFDKFLPNTQTLIIGSAVKFTGVPSGNAVIYELRDGATAQVAITFEPDGRIRVRRGGFNGTILGTSTSTFAPNVWLYIEAKVKIDPTVGTWEVRVGGVTEISGTGNTRQSSNSYANAVRFAFNAPNRYYDDLYILSDATPAPNDFIGDVKIVALFPNGAGNYSQWTPSAGLNYQAVDENPPNDDTDYVSSATATNKDSYAFGDLTGTPTVYGVQLCLRHRKDDAGARTIRPLTRISATNYFGSTISVSNSYVTSLIEMGVSPATGSSWTATELNGAEFGVELVS